MFPHTLHVAASLNPAHAYHSARSAARHTRSAGINWVFAPVLDVAVASRFPRVYESAGEDPKLAGIFGVATVQGLQGMSLRTAALRSVVGEERDREGDGRAAVPEDLSGPSVVAACMKHFIGCRSTVA
jgi:beta-glucosidase-like glycosyl hydrolase